MKDNFTRKAKVVKVVDGDTIDVVIDLGFNISIKERLRLLRVDCPEKFGITKEAGLAAKDFTTNTILDKEVYVTTFKTDSFGRWLAEVYYDIDGQSENLSDMLLKNGMAVEFK